MKFRVNKKTLKSAGLIALTAVVSVGIGYGISVLPRLVNLGRPAAVNNVRQTYAEPTTAASVARDNGSGTTAESTEESPKPPLEPDKPIHFASIEPASIPTLRLFKAKDGYNPEKDARYYKVGVVTTAGSYEGGDVLLVTAPPEGLGYDSVHHFIKQNGELVLIVKNSDELYNDDPLDRSKFTMDRAAILADLAFPEQITFNDSTFSLETSNNFIGGGAATFFSDKYKLDDIKLAFTDAKLGNVYMDASSQKKDNKWPLNGFYLKAPDGTIRTYSLDINFYDDNRNMPAVTWNDGTANAAEYDHTEIGGCGSRNYAAVASGISREDIVPSGETVNRDAVYELQDSNHAVLREIYDNDYNPYDSAKISYEEFIASRPAFFWFDPFGRLIKFQRSEFLPVAECGKPVIYLYPERTIEVFVQVEPQGGLTKSEPAYNGGWNVTATPNGQLTDLTDGKTYPYLFWEGRGGLYATPSKGFVVAEGDVHDFLLEKLTKLGLNQKEQADFMDFWEPRLKGAPYFFVTFLGTREMNELAPLAIEPKPDTVIRILMDFTPLAKPMSVEGYDIKTPVRRGFTVVEWGGVLK